MVCEQHMVWAAYHACCTGCRVLQPDPISKYVEHIVPVQHTAAEALPGLSVC